MRTITHPIQGMAELSSNPGNLVGMLSGNFFFRLFSITGCYKVLYSTVNTCYLSILCTVVFLTFISVNPILPIYPSSPSFSLR